MVYLLKFGASFVLPPGIFIILFWGLSWYAWHIKARKLAYLLASLTFCLYILSTSWFSGILVSSLEDQYNPPILANGDVIIMLGGGATSDTPDVSGKGELCSIPANRLLTAVRLQKKLQIPIILSGGQVYKDSGKEAEIARRMLLDLGVADREILIEGKSINTRENAEFSARLIREYHFQKPILVTSAYHMPRAVLNFRQQGVAVIPYPTDYVENKHRIFHYNELAPSAMALGYTETALQEYLRYAVTKYLHY